MTLHLHTELVPGCYRCDLHRHETDEILAEQSACLHLTVTCDECGAEITAPLLLTLAYGWLRWWINAHVKRLRTHLKEDR